MENYYDVHCHVFNKNVINRKLASILQSLTLIADKLKHKIDNEDIASRLDAIGSTLEELLTTSEDVYLYLDKLYDKKFIITPLMMDLTYVDDNDGTDDQNLKHKRQILKLLRIIREVLRLAKRHSFKKETRQRLDKVQDGIQGQIKKIRKAKPDDLDLFPETNYVQQIEELEDMSHKYANVKPFFGVDPRRDRRGQKRLLEIVKQKVLGDNPAFSGIKLYAPTGYSPTDPVLMGDEFQEGIYKFAEDYKIPVTVHCSDSGFASFSQHIRINGLVNLSNELVQLNNQVLTFNTKTISTDAGNAIAERATKLNHPRIWRRVLEKYPDLYINFAHFGGSTPLMEFVNYEIPERLHIFEIDDFEDDILARVSSENRNFVRNCYSKKNNKMHLLNLASGLRGKLWSVLYNDHLIDNWSKAILDIIREPRFKNAYTDLSCFSSGDMIDTIIDGETVSIFRIKHELSMFKQSLFDKLKPEVQNKMLYGSDFFFIELFGPKTENYINDFKDVFGDDFKRIASENPERFLGIT